MIRKRKSLDSAAAADPSVARSTAIEWLARRDFATGELRDKLKQRGFLPATAAEAVTELVEERLLSDAQYAGNYVGYHAARGQGPIRIAADLKSLGVDGDLIDAALAGGPDWLAVAREVRLRKFGATAPPNWAEKARQARFLQYRGFSSDHIRSALGADLDPD